MTGFNRPINTVWLMDLFASMIPRTFSINACVFFFDGFTNGLPSYLRRFCPRKSNPSSIWVMRVLSAVREDMLEHPFMADVVEAAFDVAFQHPLRRASPAQCVETLLECVGSGAFRAEAVGVGIGGSLRNGFQCQQIQCLHGAVFHRRDAERSLFSIGFGDINA